LESQIEIVEFTDPYCTWCWGSEPVLRHAQEAYGDQLRVRFVMGGLVEDRAMCAEYGVYGFPAFLVRVGERAQVISGYRGFSQVGGLIDLLAGSPVARQHPTFQDEVVLGFVDKYGSAATREVAEVFEVSDEAADEALDRLIAAGLLECVPAETGRLYRAVGGVTPKGR